MLAKKEGEVGLQLVVDKAVSNSRRKFLECSQLVKSDEASNGPDAELAECVHFFADGFGFQSLHDGMFVCLIDLIY